MEKDNIPPPLSTGDIKLSETSKFNLEGGDLKHECELLFRRSHKYTNVTKRRDQQLEPTHMRLAQICQEKWTFAAPCRSCTDINEVS